MISSFFFFPQEAPSFPEGASRSLRPLTFQGYYKKGSQSLPLRENRITLDQRCVWPFLNLIHKFDLVSVYYVLDNFMGTKDKKEKKRILGFQELSYKNQSWQNNLKMSIIQKHKLWEHIKGAPNSRGRSGSGKPS